MKAIETRYKGYRFRSRLEARWAVFFDALDLRWEYEPEGFQSGGEMYLPDFRVLYPGRAKDEAHFVWFEVKPALPLITEAEWAKMLIFSPENSLFLLDGPPSWRLYLSAAEAAQSRTDNLFRSGCALWSVKGRLWWDSWKDVFVNDTTGDVNLLMRAITAACAARFETTH